MKLGTLDWGIGGLGVHQRLLALGVADDALYLSDAGFTPYGKLEEDALAARVAGCLERLSAAGCTHVVVGCNAASTVLSHPRVRHAAATLQDVLGVISPTLDAVLAERVGGRDHAGDERPGGGRGPQAEPLLQHGHGVGVGGRTCGQRGPDGLEHHSAPR